MKQEKYKRTLIKGDITPRLVAVLREHAAQPAVITEAVNVMKIITKDDDVVATASKVKTDCRHLWESLLTC